MYRLGGGRASLVISDLAITLQISLIHARFNSLEISTHANQNSNARLHSSVIYIYSYNT